jgi:hypothetical protein
MMFRALPKTSSARMANAIIEAEGSIFVHPFRSLIGISVLMSYLDLCKALYCCPLP